MTLILREKRMVLGMTQATLSQRTGIPIRRLSRYERGLADAPPDHMRAIAAQLGLTSRPAPEIFCRRTANLESWDQVQPYCDDLGLPALPQEFQEQVPCTPMQGVAWCQLLRGGAQVGGASPAQLGFDLHPIVDDRLGYGHQSRPCLSWNSSSHKFVLWPQLRLRTRERCYLLDALVLAVDWQGAAWAALKLDGEQNDWDSRILDHLKIRLLQILPADVYSLRFARRVQTLMEPVPKLKRIDWYC